MRFFSFMLLPLSSIFSILNNPDFIDPTGTYLLKGTVERNVIKGLNGEIKVKLLEDKKLALVFNVNNGYPKFEQAFFIDTISYEDNLAKYHSVKDPDCTLIFQFTKIAVDILLLHSDPYCSCGFEKGIIVPASFEKSSSEIPVLNNHLIKN